MNLMIRIFRVEWPAHCFIAYLSNGAMNLIRTTPFLEAAYKYFLNYVYSLLTFEILCYCKTSNGVNLRVNSALNVNVNNGVTMHTPVLYVIYSEKKMPTFYIDYTLHVSNFGSSSTKQIKICNLFLLSTYFECVYFWHKKSHKIWTLYTISHYIQITIIYLLGSKKILHSSSNFFLLKLYHFIKCQHTNCMTQ